MVLFNVCNVTVIVFPKIIYPMVARERRFVENSAKEFFQKNKVNLGDLG